MTSRLIYPEAGILHATSTVKIWIYRPGGLRPVTFLCSLVTMLGAAGRCGNQSTPHMVNSCDELKVRFDGVVTS